MTNKTFADVAPLLVDMGYSPLPIALGSKQPPIKRWQTYRFNPGDTHHYGRCGTGILTGAVIAADIDVRDPALVESMRKLADKMLGKGAPARIGMAPKVALLYAVEGAPFAKLQTSGYRLPGDGAEDKAHKVEILADGQQLVVYATHPQTQQPYQWNGSGEPLTVAAADLPRVTVESVKAFVAACDALLAEHGTPVGKLRNAADGAPQVSQVGLKASNPELLRSALAAIPNEDESYDDWILICYALKGALGDAGRDDWLAWSAKSAKHDDDASLKAWNAAKPERVGAGTIFHFAKTLFGWQRPDHTPRDLTIDLLAGESAAALEQFAEAMPSVAEAEELMVYGGLLAHPYPVKRVGFDAKDVEVLAMNRLTARSLGTHVDARVAFTHPKKVGKAWIKAATDAPDKLLQSYMARPDLIARLPQQVLGISTTPVLRQDGTLASAYGFDQPSRMWIQAPAIELPATPSRIKALHALNILKSYLNEFRFADARAMSGAVALLLTAALRSSVPHAPMFVVNKHEHGEGGSTLCTLATIVQTGRAPAVITVDGGREGGDAELEKHLNAAQIAGQQTLVLDNYKNGGTIKLASLATIISESERDIRVLGESRTITCPCMQLVLVNGCNVTVADDFVRRTVQIKLDTKMASPETRTFNRPNLLLDAVADRPAILTACYTIVAAYERHLKRGGPRARVENRNGFNEWVARVAEPLKWLGLEDVAATPAELRAADPTRGLLERLLPAWLDACAQLGCPDGMTVQKIIGSHLMGSAAAAVCEILAEATEAKTFQGTPQLDSNSVGRFLRKTHGKIAGDLRTKEDGKTGGATRWKVEKVVF